MELDEAIRSKVRPYLYNNGEGRWIHCAHLACLRNRDRPGSKQFPEIQVSTNIAPLHPLYLSRTLQALGDEAFNFKFEDSELLAGLVGTDTKESHPERFTEHCWNVENRGAVGETTFHVCFLMGTPTHMYCAKRSAMASLGYCWRCSCCTDSSALTRRPIILTNASPRQF